MHDDPVLGAVAVLLQRQNAARIDDDALDLEARAHIDRLVITPRPVAALVIDRFSHVLRDSEGVNES